MTGVQTCALPISIAARLLTAVTPLTIKLALEALTNLEARDKTIFAQCRRRIERARYDADLAERRYEEADPSNRLVTSTLEKRWNEAMQRIIELEAEIANFERQAMRSLTPEQKQQILQLGKDLPRLWKAPTTSACDRKRMLRLLVRDITVVKGAEPKLLHLQIRWQGGATETIDVRRQPNRAEATRYPDTFVAKIRTMAEKYDDEEIVRRLNGERLTSSTGKAFTVSIVRWIRFKHRIPGPSLPTGTLTVSQVCERYGVSLWVVHYWIERGVVSAVQRKPNAPYAVVIDNAVDRRLRKWVRASSSIIPNANCMRCNMRGASAPPKYVVRHSFWEWEQRAPVAESSYLRSSDSRSCRGSSQDLGRTAQATAHPLRPRPHWL